MTRVASVSLGMRTVACSVPSALNSAAPSAGRCAGSFRNAAAVSAASSGGASGLQRLYGRRRRVPVHVDEREGVVRNERQRARQHPEEDDPERVDVARGSGRLSRRLLRREVCGRAEYRPRLGQGSRAGNATSQPEVAELRPAFLVEHDVGGLEVAVDEPAGVEVREPRGHPQRHASRLGGRQRLVPQAFLERPAGQPLECHERPGLVLAIVVDAHDVLVGEGTECLRLPTEAARDRRSARGA